MEENINKALSDEHNKKCRKLIELAKKELKLIDNNELTELEKIREEKIKLQQEIKIIEQMLF
ncbi:hypothetical protein MKZ08_16395 [Viridibacillus sp. FSL R5-0477]|uniref:Uncharacterized protein n=1 Tax=Viridibacillus arenosi FSL R5-213 TaxID=1227360 RepID=W4ELW8_9BACL|nr:MULTISPECIES: hypothetical protein [Viridibacillus]ETT81249.1 hypothetical protein C176_21124 [Viridibacillus arenosi FSL R5-213]OMC84188.1 hypothetical protein BK130_06760 [Viridibacillus sp. FSL H8-0123]OMC88709.1 hypothetical protein BK128_01870 [Viridibacillus sp. FSL H7-0596]OMC93342.1 hypothetical protein BK137_02165 [Viridibacillus arenosi]